MATWLNASQFLQKATIEHALGLASTSLPTLYLALLTSSAGETGDLSGEPLSGGYARQAITTKMSSFATDADDNYSSTLSVFTQFATPSAAWGTIGHIAFVDSPTPGIGNVYWYGELDSPFEILAGSSPPEFAIGQFVLTIAGSNLTEAAGHALGNHFLGKSAMTMPVAVDMHLFTASPGAAGSFANEANYTGYSAVELTSKMANATLSGADAGIARNDVAVTFGTPSAGDDVISYIGISDGGSAPVLLLYAPLRNALTVANGDPAGPTFPIGSIAVQVT